MRMCMSMCMCMCICKCICIWYCSATVCYKGHHQTCSHVTTDCLGAPFLVAGTYSHHYEQVYVAPMTLIDSNHPEKLSFEGMAAKNPKT